MCSRRPHEITPPVAVNPYAGPYYLWQWPHQNFIATTYVERANLTMRMHMRMFARLTNGFSKKLENHMHAVSLHFMFYNFCKIHSTLRVTPAMEAKIDDHVWTMEEVVMVADTNV